VALDHVVPMNCFIFVVTKPLQLIIATAIVSQLRGKGKVFLCVVDHFYDSKNVTERLKNEKSDWDGVCWFADKKDAIFFAVSQEPKCIFVDSDVGFYNSIVLLVAKIISLKTLFYIFEEGIGSYRDDLYAWPKNKVLESLGIATSFGQSKSVSGIWLYEPSKYLKKFKNYNKECYKIDREVCVVIRENLDFFTRIFDFSDFFDGVVIQSSTCNIYISSWSVDYDVIEQVSKKFGDLYIKQHPHIKYNEVKSNHVGMLIPTSVPAEIVVVRLLSFYSKVNIYHHGSSLVKYLPKMDGVTEFII